MRKKIAFHLSPTTLLVLITIIVHHVWFFNLAPITYGDWTIDHIETVREYFNLPFIWKSDIDLGNIAYGIFFWPLQVLIGFSAFFISNSALLERLFILWPVALITPLSMYFLSYYILKSRVSAVISAIVFTFNTILIISRSGPLVLHLATTFTPLYLLFFIRTLESKNISYALIAALIGFIVSFVEVRMFYIAVWILFFYFVFHLLMHKNDILKMKLYLLALMAVFLPVILNLYGLLGLQNLESLTSNEIFNHPLFGASYLNLLKIMTLFHSDWTGGVMEAWVSKPILPRFFFIPILAFLGLVLTKNKKLPFFAFLALLSIFLTKLTLPPFPNIYQWLYDHMPGFNAFRESGKFSYFITFSYAILIGAFVQAILSKANRYQKLASYTLTAAIALLFLWNTKPVIKGELRSLYVPRSIPKDYISLKKFILNQPDYFKTLWVPMSSQWGIRTFNHPRISNYGVNQRIWNKFVKINKGNIYGPNFSAKLLDLSSIKYVIVPLEDKENEDNFFRFTGKRQEFIEEIDNLRYLRKIKTDSRKIAVYENANFRPHIYATNEKDSIYKDIPYHTVDFQFINPTEYRIYLYDVVKPFFLNFSESYHPSWKIRVGKFNRVKAILEHNYFLSKKYHFENDAGLNSFLLEPEKVCAQKHCVITLYFEAQSYVYVGIAVSGIILFFMLLLLLYKKLVI